ncbi:transposase [Fusarium oxysporum f. sp. phaseoli]
MASIFGQASEARSTAHYGWICVGFLHAKAKFFYDPREFVRYLEDAVRSLALFPFNMHDKATWGGAAGRKWASAGDLKPIGKNWIEGFLWRNPSFKTLRGKAVDFNRLEEAATEKVQDCFWRLPLSAVKRITPQYRYNMDETSIMEGKGNNGLVLGSSDNDSAPFKVLGGRLWASILEVINAFGFSLPPLITFQGI